MLVLKIKALGLQTSLRSSTSGPLCYCVTDKDVGGKIARYQIRYADLFSASWAILYHYQTRFLRRRFCHTFNEHFVNAAAVLP